MNAGFDRLVAAVAEDAARPVPPGLDAVVEAVRARFGPAVAAVLFYGSCLRTGSLDGVIDLYVLVDAYERVYDRAWLAMANRLLPPNVFFLSVGSGAESRAVKVAVYSLDRFERAVRPGALLPSVWARFAQPVALVYARDEAARARATKSLAQAVATAAAHGARLAPAPVDPLELWRTVIRASYGAELRAERAGRADEVVDAFAERYRRLTRPALAAAGIPFAEEDGRLHITGPRRNARFAWALRRPLGKLVNLLRLAKAVFTFECGADYLVWKIERHTGLRPALTPWQRRHPLIALPLVAWRLWRRGVVR
ncbi:MAG: hypothetical protein WD673_10260 [Alphaproteobacteria bacterium]